MVVVVVLVVVAVIIIIIIIIIIVVVVVVVDSHKMWGTKWCTQGSRKCSAGQVMAQPKGMVIGFVRPDWFGVFPTALVQLFSCGRTTSPQHSFASHYITIYAL